MTPSRAVVLLNMGTPDAPEANAIRRYLRQFLSDRRVVNLPWWFWGPILHLFILRFRPQRLVKKYQLIWGTRDGPLRNISQALARRLQTRLNTASNIPPGREQAPPDTMLVAAAMTYGQPSINTVLKKLMAANVRRILFIPMFPQYANATVGAAIDEINRALANQQQQPDVIIKGDYHTNSAYIRMVARAVSRAWAYRAWQSRQASGQKDGAWGDMAQTRVVFSFHGIPQAVADAGDPYPLQCQETARLVARQLDLGDDQWLVTYQSRFGFAGWLRPYTDETMRRLPAAGIKHLVVVCPGFAVDCLETIEEIRLLNRRIFLDAGGETFHYIKALNATWNHVEIMADMVHSTDWPASG